MKIVTKVKGIDDFGKEKISGNVFKYSHHHPRINEGDFLIYFYPKDNAIGIYQAKEELEYYYKDGFQYCSGKMYRYEKSALDFIEWIKSKNVELADTFEKTMNDLIEKYSYAVGGN
jgi:hypothetical protein